MATQQDIARRIRSVRNTGKITKAMELVAASRLRRAQARIQGLRPYADRLQQLTVEVAAATSHTRGQPLLERREVKGVAVLALTADRGLAGAFNANLIKEARLLVQRLESEGTQVELHIVGRKGIGFFRYLGRELATARTDITDRPTAGDARSLADSLIENFTDGALDAVYVVYAKFNSALSTPATAEQVLPVTPPQRSGIARDYILAPSADAILTELLPLYVRNSIYRALVETVAGEQSARRTAMKNATDNASDMINVLRRTYNRARQAQITQEIAEIVGGAAALE